MGSYRQIDLTHCHSHQILPLIAQLAKRLYLPHARLRGSAQRETLAELTVEMDNFRTAWDWGIASGEFALVEQTLRTLTMLYDTRGWYQEGIDTLDRAVTTFETTHTQSLPDRVTQVALRHLLATRSLLASRMGQYEQARVGLERSLEILRL